MFFAGFIGPSRATGAAIHWVMNTDPLSCPVNPWLPPCLSVWAQQACMAWLLVTGINQGPPPGHWDLYPQGWGAQEICKHPHPPTLKHTTSKWQCNPPTTYGVPSVKHKLDMETTCICIHVTGGCMSPSQPKPITERLLFSFCGS